ncbi:MAG: ATP-binding protein [bacterium]
MLHEFKLKNFYSFADEVTVSFCVGQHAPDNSLFLVAPSGQRLSRMLTAIGPNASGKTNLLKGLSFLKWFMLMSFRMLDPKETLPVDRFAFAKDPQTAMSFRLVFEINGGVYQYEVEIVGDQVTREILERKTDRNFGYLFRREWNATTKSVDIREQNLAFDVDAVKTLVRDNCSLLSVLHQTENKALQPVFDYLDDMQTNVDRWGRDPHRSAEHLGHLLAAAKFFHKHPDYKADAERLLTGKLDFGLSGIAIQEEKYKSSDKGEPGVLFVPYGLHKVDGHEYRLALMEESSGTQNSFVLLHKLLPVLRTGGLAVIDEFEVDLHPQMISPILDLFLDPETNPKNAQLLFSTHSIEVLRKLDKTQVLLVDKDERCRSHVCRLDEIKGVRRDVDLYAKYMSGAYGAVPNI